jgi:hypothetical protein
MAVSGPVDVLAVLDEAASWLPYDGEDNRIRERFAEARAAVAELIEALEGMVSIHDSVTMRQEWERRDEWLPKARAALSNITGATK